MHNEQELEELREVVNQTIKLGKRVIVNVALKDVSIHPESIINDDKITISVWYNDIQVKVEFNERSPIRYFPIGSQYFLKKTVYVSLDKVSGSGGEVMYNNENEGLAIGFNKAYLYQTTEQKQKTIDLIFELNNRNDPKYHKDQAIQQYINIREREAYYEMQIGDEFPSTYKISKKSGEIYDYKDPYRNFYPSPDSAPIGPPPVGGPWIELKE